MYSYYSVICNFMLILYHLVVFILLLLNSIWHVNILIKQLIVICKVEKMG